MTACALCATVREMQNANSHQTLAQDDEPAHDDAPPQGLADAPSPAQVAQAGLFKLPRLFSISFSQQITDCKLLVIGLQRRLANLYLVDKNVFLPSRTPVLDHAFRGAVQLYAAKKPVKLMLDMFMDRTRAKLLFEIWEPFPDIQAQSI